MSTISKKTQKLLASLEAGRLYNAKYSITCISNQHLFRELIESDALVLVNPNLGDYLVNQGFYPQPK